MLAAAGVRFIDGGDELLDAAGEGVDLGGEGVDLVQQHPGQLAVVGVEAAIQRGDQGRVLGRQPAPGQIGQAARVALAGDEGFEHVTHRQQVQGGGHRRHLDQGVLEQFLQPLPVAGAFPGQVLA